MKTLITAILFVMSTSLLANDLPSTNTKTIEAVTTIDNITFDVDELRDEILDLGLIKVIHLNDGTTVNISARMGGDMGGGR